VPYLHWQVKLIYSTIGIMYNYYKSLGISGKTCEKVVPLFTALLFLIQVSLFTESSLWLLWYYISLGISETVKFV